MIDTLDAQTPRYPVRLVSVRTGLSPHVLRAWERRYGVVSPTRTEGGQRLYSDLDVERLVRLRRLTDRGHAIRRIATLPLAQLARMDEEAAAEQDRDASLEGQAAGADEAIQVRAGKVHDSIAAAMQATTRLDA